ncbi:uncharacterized protein [Dysidea avara]|uniref:uncharacterized protein n=1 Tax=Dysidea avara TaxID=196820 RepID=UPI0033196B52
MYVPILQTLQALLQNKTVVSEIEHGHLTSPKLVNDYCDGEYFKVHPLFSVHTNGLQIFLYFDELEICNPIGSKVKVHKLGSFYFTLGNLSPKYRSKLTSIYLLALVKSTFISTYGMDAVLKPFINDMKKLEQGHQFLIHGTPR